MWLSSITWVSPVRLRTRGGAATSASDISARVVVSSAEALNAVTRGVGASGECWGVGGVELAAVAARVAREVKLSVAVGLRKFILMN